MAIDGGGGGGGIPGEGGAPAGVAAENPGAALAKIKATAANHGDERRVKVFGLLLDNRDLFLDCVLLNIRTNHPMLHETGGMRQEEAH